MAKKQTVHVKVNGREREASVEPRTLLVHFIRDYLRLTGPHVGCDTSNCGACTVILDGKNVKSCTMFAVQADGSELLTVEGLIKDGEGPHVHLCSAPTESRSDRRGNPLGHFRQFVPLHRLSEHRESSSVCRRQDGTT